MSIACCVFGFQRAAAGTCTRLALAGVLAFALTACAPPPDQAAAPTDTAPSTMRTFWGQEEHGDQATRESQRSIHSELLGLEREAARSMTEIVTEGGRAGTSQGSTPGAPSGELGREMMELQREMQQEQREIRGTFPGAYAPEDPWGRESW